MAGGANKTGNIRGPLWAGTCTTGTGGAFSCSFPSGLFTKPPIVSIQPIASNGVVNSNAPTTGGVTGTVYSIPALVGLASVVLHVVAVAPS